MARVFLSVGSNLGDRLACLRRAVEQLRAMQDLRFLDASPLYRTEPWERQPGGSDDDSGWFFNCAVAIETELTPGELLTRLQAVEETLGRERREGTPEAQRYVPRPLDIDILLYDDRVISGPEHLHIPHLLMHERRFVLRPLADLAPDLEHPVLYQTIRELLDVLEDEHEVWESDLPRRWFDTQ
jgi:2-amino-4-hydroxy-6-hydroxymethyldihydropteridine diphosphokinase